MAFDCCTYEKALEKFIFMTMRNSGRDVVIASDSVKDLCEVLDISRLDAELYKNVSEAEQRNGEITTIFDD
ncbi:MAG: hypothetical protein IKK42_05385, partial [Oscillospiraceae bacterium]|nr:hypothetical protein [Oscillospiraceae bacterium]